MQITSILRGGVVALALMAGFTAATPAFADSTPQAQAQAQAQSSNTGPYDGAAFQAETQNAATADY